ncbi:MAG TPA: hypothetical protein VIF43_00535 [Patescibacteria group bacterium]|jgi:hypothetical protein
MAEESAGRIEAEAVAKPAAKLTLEIEGLDLEALDPETREELDRTLFDLAHVLREGLVHGMDAIDPLSDGVSNAMIQAPDRVFEQSRSGRDAGTA